MQKIIRSLFIFLIFNIFFGQNSFAQFFINDSINDFKLQKCWQLTKSNSSSIVYKNAGIEIVKAEVINHTLLLNIGYSGGCGKTYMRLFYDSSAYKISNLNITLFIEFINNDPCEVAYSRKVCFDLDEILIGRKEDLFLKLNDFEFTIPAK